MSHVTRAVPDATDRHPLLAWFGFLGGGAAWALHLTLTYVVIEIDCRSTRLAFDVLGLPAAHALDFVLTGVAVVTALAAGATAFSALPGLPSSPARGTVEGHESVGRMRFMALTGMVSSGFFAVAILAGGSGYLFLRGCA